MFKRDPALTEQRRYLRLDTVFPVQFCLVAKETGEIISAWLQGFTNNIGKGGICVEINNLSADLVKLLKDKKVGLSLNIELPLKKKQIPAQARVTWVREATLGIDKYLLGLSYEKIDSGQNKMIMHYAWVKKLSLPVTLAVIILLGLGFSLGSYLNLKLIKGNKALVNQLVSIVQESSIAKQKVKEITRQREQLQLEIQALQSRIEILEAERKTNSSKEINILMEKLGPEKISLQEQLLALGRKETVITEDLLRLYKKKAALQKANLDKMYQWLEVHQNPHSGLVMSFEGDNNLKDQAFIYDQSLVLQAYTYFADFSRVRKILKFFAQKAQRQNNLFLNGYYVNDGSPLEYTVHSGPNIWLGIGILQYTKKSQDTSYLNLAEDIARAIISLQNQDPDGGIRGGPNAEWFSTEHNLDAYAFFNMLYKLTGKSVYQTARDKVLAWLVKHTYDHPDLPIKRGKGDATIATDTYAWSIAAITPAKLEALGMNPDRIMEFAEQNCCVEVIFSRPEGYSVKVRGFDFAAEHNLARGGVVSSEWTAQMVIAFKIMADYSYQKGLKAKGHAYEVKADEYMASLGKMVISSPSPSGQGQSCLPYATQDFVDTGHGWMTPKGDSTGCVAGTVYTIFAYYKYNPLELN